MTILQKNHFADRYFLFLGEIFFEKETRLEKIKREFGEKLRRKNQNKWLKNIFLEQNIGEKIAKKVLAKNHFYRSAFLFLGWNIFGKRDVFRKNKIQIWKINSEEKIKVSAQKIFFWNKILEKKSQKSSSKKSFLSISFFVFWVKYFWKKRLV